LAIRDFLAEISFFFLDGFPEDFFLDRLTFFGISFFFRDGLVALVDLRDEGFAFSIVAFILDRTLATDRMAPFSPFFALESGAETLEAFSLVLEAFEACEPPFPDPLEGLRTGNDGSFFFFNASPEHIEQGSEDGGVDSFLLLPYGKSLAVPYGQILPG
jgi:hypothetical protein